jgi:hypothetical protein
MNLFLHKILPIIFSGWAPRYTSAAQIPGDLENKASEPANLLASPSWARVGIRKNNIIDTAHINFRIGSHCPVKLSGDS